MKAIYTIITLLFLNLFSFGGNDFQSTGAAEKSLGNHTSTLVNSFSIFNNQATAAFLEQTAFGLSYQSSYFPAKINHVTFAAAHPMKAGTIGGGVSYFGNDLYYEMKLGLAYALKLGKKVGIGVQLDYLNSKAQDLDGKHFVTFELGVLYQPIDQVMIGAHVFNPVKWEVDEDTDEILPIVFNIGLQYKPHDKIIILAELEKDIEHPFNFKGEIEYKVVEQFRVRGGFNTNPALFSFGGGFYLKDFLVIDIASNYHLELGFNTNASISFYINKKEEKVD